MRSLIFLLFVGLAATVMVLGHIYLWRRLARDLTDRPWLRRAILIGLLSMVALVVCAMALPRVVGRGSAGPFVFGGLLWMGAAFYLLVFLWLFDLIRLGNWLIAKLRKRDPASETWLGDPGRRQFLARLTAGGALLASGGLSALAVRAARSQITTPEVPVRLDRLPAALSGFRIALLSDMHLGPTLGADFTRRVVDATNALRPDAVVIVGDLVDGKVELIGQDVAPLADLRAEHGVFFTTGNHEYYVGVRPWLAFLGRIGIQVLDNRHVSIGDRAPGGARFVLAGINDRQAGWVSEEAKPDPVRALSGVEPEAEVVMLAHQPRQVDEVAALGVGLQLSGHTHGGQLFPFGALTQLAQPYLSGLHRHGARTQIYVTRGTGYWGPPMRVLAPAEISQIILTS